MEFLEMINVFSTMLAKNIFFWLFLIGISLDTVLGFLRAIKEHKFNSAAGIDGAIRKCGMVIAVCAFGLVDMIVKINIAFMVPDQVLNAIGLQKIGMCEFFCLLFVLYEAVSILKNMTLCGMPVPRKAERMIRKFLDEMTEEMPEASNKALKGYSISTQLKKSERVERREL